MKILIFLSFYSFFSFSEVVITNHEGKVKVNDLEITKKTPLELGYKVSVPATKDAFAVLTFKGGNRILVLSGEIIIESTEELNAKISLKSGEVFFHIENPDRRLITPVLTIKTNSSVFNVFGGESYINLQGSQLYYAVAKGKTEYEDPWGKLTAAKSESISKINVDQAPIVRPIIYKMWKKIKIGFERMGFNLN